MTFCKTKPGIRECYHSDSRLTIFYRLGSVLFRTRDTVFLAAFRHSLDTSFCLGVRREHLLHIARLTAGFLLHFQEFFECHNHTPRVPAFGHEEIIAAVVGFLFLLLRILGIEKALTESAKL